MVEVMVERSFCVILNVQIRFVHASKYIIWHQDHPIRQVVSLILFANFSISLTDMAAVLKNGRHLEFLSGTHTSLKE